MKKTDKEISKLYSEARRIAGACLATLPGLPDRSEVSDLTNALLAAGLVTGGKSSSSVDRAGADADQDSLLDDAYAGTDRNQPAGGNF
jgi:hypothetical protein